MICVFDMLQDFQGLSPFLNAGISTIELKNLGCCVQYKDIIVVE
jgi:hypothetical protein